MRDTDPRQRLMLVYGEDKVDELKFKRVMIAGLGGVGGYAAEAIARSFVGTLMLADFDVYDVTNLNRQLHSDLSNIGMSKTDVVEAHIRMINPDVRVVKVNERLTPENMNTYVDEDIDFVIDAIDDIRAKAALICFCADRGINIISSMGTGNKVHPELLRIGDIYETSVCPLAKRMRKILRDAGIVKLPVVYSMEEVKRLSGSSTVGSTAFVPGTAGLMLASYVINNMLGQ